MLVRWTTVFNDPTTVRGYNTTSTAPTLTTAIYAVPLIIDMANLNNTEVSENCSEHVVATIVTTTTGIR